MKHNDGLRSAALLLVPAGIYLLLDLPARFTGFIGLASFAGPKNFLPLLMGLLLGPWGVPGMCLGAAASALLAGSPMAELLSELAGIPILALGGWYLWYHKNGRPPRLKQGRDYGRFLAITAVLAPLSSLPALALLGAAAWAEMAAFCGLFTVLVGVPVLILASSILCILPVCPRGKTPAPDIDCQISSESGGLDAANEQIETFCQAHGFPMKKAMAVENCVEEFALRIQNADPEALIHARLYLSDSVSVFLSFSGARYNPLRKGQNEAAEDLWSLTLIRERALRASYQYSSGVNRLHIVI